LDADKVVIYNSFGVIVMQEDLEGQNSTDISLLPKGMYYLTLKGKGKQLANSIFVKQ